MKRVKEVVCFGGGEPMLKVVLPELKKYPLNITSVSSMVDSGGSTGQLRKELNVLPPGDISRHLVALSDGPSWKKDLCLFRFGKEKFPGGHQGHRFGTVFIALLEYLLKDFEKALKVAHEFLEVKKHQALPATIKKTHLLATLENGKRIKGENEIDVPKVHNGNLKIKKVYLKPKVPAYPPILEAIKKADLLIFGPGDLYSSLIPCFLPEGMKEAIKESKAKKILVCNLMTKYGETNNFSVLDFVKEIEKYLGGKVDYVIYNTERPLSKRLATYKKEHPELLNLVNPVNFDKYHLPKFIGKKLLLKKGPIEHDSKKLAEIILDLL